MALSIHSGDLRYRIELKSPVETKNDEGGVERSYTSQIITYAAIRAIDTRRVNEAAATALLHSKDFYIRWSETREDSITKDWILIYQGDTYTIHEIENIDEKGRFIRLTAKFKAMGVPLIGSGSGGGGTSIPDSNYTFLSFDPLTGLLTFSGVADNHYTQMEYLDPDNTSFNYVSAEGSGVSSSPFQGLSTTAEYFTVGTVLLRWKRVTPPPQVAPLTGTSTYLLTVTRLARRWYYLFKDVGGINVGIAPGFGGLHVFNINGVDLGMAHSIEELIDLWNGDPDNAEFGQIIGHRTVTPGMLQVQIEPGADETAYPIKFVRVSL